MKVVVFSSNYPPLRNPRAFRVGRYFPLLREHGEALLITAPVKGYTEPEPGVIRTGFRMKPYSPLRKQLKRNWLLNKLHACILPDDKVLYQIWYLLYYLIKCRRKGDLIISVSFPFSSHLIGLTLKYLLGHSWIADIGDVYANSLNKKRVSGWKQAFENKVLRNADHVIVNAQSLKQFYCQRRSIAEEKISLIPNGISAALSMIVHQPSDILRISYIGNTYGDTRDGLSELEVLLMTIRKFPKLIHKIQLYGTQFHKLETLANKYPEWILLGTCHSDVELADAYSKTDILLNFANADNPGLPSKLEEYLATGLPIINFYYSHDEASIFYLSSAQCKVLHIDLKHPDLVGLHDFLSTMQPGIQPKSKLDPISLEQQWHKILSLWPFPA